MNMPQRRVFLDFYIFNFEVLYCQSSQVRYGFHKINRVEGRIFEREFENKILIFFLVAHRSQSLPRCALLLNTK